MKRRAIALAILAALWLGSADHAIAQTQDDPEAISGLIPARNGRFWNHLSAGEKLAYLRGFQEAVAIVSLATTTSYDQFKTVSDSYAGQSTFGEIIEGLNAFYVDPANRPIAVAAAMIWYQNKARGKTAAELQEQLEKMRSAANSK